MKGACEEECVRLYQGHGPLCGKSLQVFQSSSIVNISKKNLFSSSEMHFLPRPGGSDEDDGVLVTIVFDGPKEQVQMDEMRLVKILMTQIIIALENDFFKELLASAGCKNLPTD